MKIAFINDIHVGKDAVKDGHVRAASSKAFSYLPSVINQIKKHLPDLLVDLGDLIRSESVSEDFRNYEKTLNIFESFEKPVIHLLGNHEVKQLKVEDIKSIWQKQGIEQEVFGSRVVNGIKCIWLDFEQEKNAQGIRTTLPQTRLDWLDEELSKDKTPVIILSHYVLTDQNLDGNFYFEKPLNIFGEYNNKEVVLAILKKHRHILSVFSAHTHELHFKVVDNIPHITLPAMVENIAAPETNDNFPEVYTIVNIEEKIITVKCYSRQYCFTTLEIKI